MAPPSPSRRRVHPPASLVTAFGRTNLDPSSNRFPFVPSKPPTLSFVNELLKRRPLNVKEGRGAGALTSEWIEKYVNKGGVATNLGTLLKRRREEEDRRRKEFWEQRQKQLEEGSK